MGGGTVVKEGYLIKSPPLNSKGVKVSRSCVVRLGNGGDSCHSGPFVTIRLLLSSSPSS